MTFDELKLAEPILRAIRETGYTAPTPIQEKAIPHALDGKDVLGNAQTGTGKTAAFALPILHRLLHSTQTLAPQQRALGARALVLCPTRELALQIHESFTTYGKYCGLSTVAIYGGVHQMSQVMQLRAGADILVATPGRLMDLMGQRLARVTMVETVVLDEADRMLDIGFLPDIRKIMAHVPDDRQTLLFSATMPPPIQALVREIQRDPVHIQTARVSSAATTVEQWVHFVDPHHKPDLLARLLARGDHRRALVFTRTKRTTDVVAGFLRKKGVRAVALHGDKEQEVRNRVMAAFRSEQPPVLVATDIAARGLDVDDISHVFNYDILGEPESYVHRIGRAGRAGATGTAISFCAPAERKSLRAIESLIRMPLKRADEGGEPAGGGDKRRSHGPHPRHDHPHRERTQHASGNAERVHSDHAAAHQPSADRGGSDRTHAVKPQRDQEHGHASHSHKPADHRQHADRSQIRDHRRHGEHAAGEADRTHQTHATHKPHDHAQPHNRRDEHRARGERSHQNESTHGRQHLPDRSHGQPRGDAQGSHPARRDAHHRDHNPPTHRGHGRPSSQSTPPSPQGARSGWDVPLDPHQRPATAPRQGESVHRPAAQLTHKHGPAKSAHDERPHRDHGRHDQAPGAHAKRSHGDAADKPARHAAAHEHRPTKIHDRSHESGHTAPRPAVPGLEHPKPGHVVSKATHAEKPTKREAAADRAAVPARRSRAASTPDVAAKAANTKPKATKRAATKSAASLTAKSHKPAKPAAGAKPKAVKKKASRSAKSAG